MHQPKKRKEHMRSSSDTQKHMESVAETTLETFETISAVARTRLSEPLPDRMLMHPELRCDDLVRQALGAAQDHPAALRQGARDPVPAPLPLQIRSFFLVEYQSRHRAANGHDPPARPPCVQLRCRSS